jgi:hypothetical protein
MIDAPTPAGRPSLALGTERRPVGTVTRCAAETSRAMFREGVARLPLAFCVVMDPTPAERERTWFRLHDAFPPGWRVGPASYDPARHRWTVSAWSPVGGRRHPPEETLTGVGVDELGAVTDLAMTLEERARADAIAEVDRRGRLAFLTGAEEQSRRLGRSLTEDELNRVLRRFPRGE